MSGDLQNRILDAVLVSLRPGGAFSAMAYVHARGFSSARNFRRELQNPTLSAHQFAESLNVGDRRRCCCRQMGASAVVLQECPNFTVCATKVENKGVSIALENQPQVETTAAFHERGDAAQADAGVQVWLPESFRCCFHHLENLGSSFRRDTLLESRGCEKLHGARSARLLTSRSWPALRAWDASRFMRTPARAISGRLRPYSAAK